MESTHDWQKFQREWAILQFAASQTAAQTAAHHGQSYPSTMTLFWAASALLTGLPVQGMSHTLLWLQILFSILVFGVLLVAAHLRNIELHSAQDFEQFGCHMAGIPWGGSARVRLHQFKAHFGVSPSVATSLWAQLAHSRWLTFDGFCRPKLEHLLWCLLWMKGYGVEELSAATVGTTEKTFRKWAWFYSEGIAQLDSTVVSLLNHVVFCFLVMFVTTLSPNCSLQHCSFLLNPLGESLWEPQWRALPRY